MCAISTKKCNYTGGVGGVNYVHLQNKCRKEDFQNIIYLKLRKKQNINIIIKNLKNLEIVLGSYLLTDLLLVKKWKMVNVKLGETNMKIN